jgi:hypothetical protein
MDLHLYNTKHHGTTCHDKILQKSQVHNNNTILIFLIVWSTFILVLYLKHIFIESLPNS